MFWFHQSLGFSTRTVESTFSNPDHGDQIIKPFVIFSMGCQDKIYQTQRHPTIEERSANGWRFTKPDQDE
jgi:hypothetical protein